MPANKIIHVYTDGSCHTQLCTGAWAAVLLGGDEKIVLSGLKQDTTHNRMELLAVIESIHHIRQHYPAGTQIHIFSDSQYVTQLADREEKLAARQFTTRRGTEIKNADLVQELLSLLEDPRIQMVKVKAHQKKGDEPNYNTEADKLSRKMVRDAVKDR
ncbi:ribonuclease H family protein [Chitinophagaceae bacterium MMS25-I14]